MICTVCISCCYVHPSLETLDGNAVLQLDPAIPGVFNGPYPLGIDPVKDCILFTVKKINKCGSFCNNANLGCLHTLQESGKVCEPRKGTLSMPEHVIIQKKLKCRTPSLGRSNYSTCHALFICQLL